MLTGEDIKNIVENVVKAEKEVFYTKPELNQKFQKLESSFASLQTSVDRMTTVFQKYHDEQQVLVGKLKHIEDWIKKASAKLGVDYNP